jgi:hypothetical protein
VELSNTIEAATVSYRALRATQILWTGCLWKQTLGAIATPLGMTGQHTVERSVGILWAGGAAVIPDEVLTLRAYVASL